MLVRLTIADDFETRIYSGYDPDLVAAIKEVPGRKWDAGRKYWSVPSDFATDLASRLRRLGYSVVVDDLRPRQQTKTAPPSAWADDLLGQLFNVNPLLVEKAHAALTKVLHPDLGHDTGRLMQQLNDARADLQRYAS